MAKSKIEWTESTWNPVTGCTKISAGCKYCYAEIMTGRLMAMGQEKYLNGFNLAMHPKTLNEPYLWKRPRMIFVNSMSDLFHKDVPVKYIQQVFSTIRDNPHHTFQILTKRSDILFYYDCEGWLDWPSNLWMGVTVENADVMFRIDHLRKTKAMIKFISCEPLLSDIPDLNLNNIDWVIVGGESGCSPRPMEKEWVLNIREHCEKSKTAFYFKQWGGTNKKKTGRLLDGKIYDEMPERMHNNELVPGIR